MISPSHHKAAHKLAGEILKAAVPAADNEPDRAEKLRAEAQLMAAINRYFGKLVKKVTARLRIAPPKQQPEKAGPEFNDDFWTDADFVEELIKVLTEAIKRGALRFTEMVNLEINQGLVNKEAAEFIREYAFDLVKNLADTSRAMLQSVIEQFVTTPGMTIGDVIAQLPFDETRATLIATTEITRAYAEGQQLAAEQTAKEWPDVPVTKLWHTNMDDRVCPICAPLDGVSAEAEEDFDAEFENPPAHPACRCWISYRTNINA